MKAAVILLALVPLAFAAPEKRFFLSTFGLDIGELKATVQHIVDTLGTDASESQCEGACHAFLSGDEAGLIHTACNPLCKSFQSLTHLFHIAPHREGKRFFVDSFVDMSVVKGAVKQLLDVLGMDATEAQCEAKCHGLLFGDETALVHTLCTPICRSFQSLVHVFHQSPGKRFFFDSLVDLDVVKKAVKELWATLGQDATEQQCEAKCHNLVMGDETALLHTLCNPICRSFQSLVQIFHPQNQSPGKRFFLDNLNVVKDAVKDLLDTVGQDATEQQCEAACHNLVMGDETALLHTLCTPICRSFQSLVHLFHHTPNKRFFIDNLLDLNVVKDAVKDLLDTVGQDATEQQCEAACHNLVMGDETALLHTLCTPICRSFQSLVHLFHHTPTKRFFIDNLLDLNVVKDAVKDLLDTVGQDATEQQCEAACHNLVMGDETALLHTLCTPICRSFQSLVHLFHHTPTKRFFIDNLLDLNVVKDAVKDLLDTVGQDATEQQCEAACHNLVMGDETALLHTLCTPICRSFQSLVHLFHHTPNKRFFIDNFLDLGVVKKAVKEIFDTLGQDATEQQCEAKCHTLVMGDETTLLHTLCSPICRSFQSLVHLFHPTKRFIIDSVVDLGVVKEAVKMLLDTIGTDATEQVCEAKCHTLVLGDETALLHTLCPTICRSFQSLVHLFHHQSRSLSKRFFIDNLLDLNVVKDAVKDLLDTVGQDATEQQCEAACHNLVMGDETALLHTLCTPICRSFQSLVHLFHHTPSDVRAKRFFIDNLLDLNVVKEAVTMLLDTLGKDATEQQCEAKCHTLVMGDETTLLHTLCSPICRSFQSLVHLFHSQSSTPSKRFLLDSLLDLNVVKEAVKELLDTIGTDATEQQCEAKCHTLVMGDETVLLHTLCTPICRSFQSLVHLFHHNSKRFIMHGLVDFGVVHDAVTGIFDKLGRDATEQQCETACHGLVMGDETALIHTLCSPICRSFQELVHFFHPTKPEVTAAPLPTAALPASTTAAPVADTTAVVSSAPANKRFFLDSLVDLGVVKDAVKMLLDTIGTDATEQQCEAKCHTLVMGDETALLHTLCTPICRSFQSLVHLFHHNRVAPAA